MGKGQELYKRAKEIIPGGTQLLSKRPEMFLPDLWPAYYDRAKGCEVWDLDGKKYIDMSFMGIGTCVLGYADDEVNAAVEETIRKGSMCTLNAPEEVELAELLIKLHPWADMVRYTRTGGESMSVAVRIARASSGKDGVVFCGYHGWHDWYLAANLADDRALDGHLLPGLDPTGVPRQLKGSTLTFQYNDLDGFKRVIENNKGQIGVVVMESRRNQPPQKGFIETIRQMTQDLGIVLIFDEITAGWRINNGGVHLMLGVQPDIAVYAKAISNGFPMAAVVGNKKTMHSAQDSFISSTYWTERIGPVAALATIKKFIGNDVSNHLIAMGKLVKQGWASAARKNYLLLDISGMDPLAHFEFKYDNHLAIKTLFTQLMLERGYLASNAFYASFAHSSEIVEEYIQAVDESFKILSKAIELNTIEKQLKGGVVHSGFKRLT